MSDSESRTDVKQAWTVAGLVLIVSLFFGLVILPKLGPQESDMVGVEAPDFTLPSASRDGVGKPVSLHDYRGKVIVLAFFFRARTSG